MKVLVQSLLFFLLLMPMAEAGTNSPDCCQSAFAQGIARRQQGALQDSVDIFFALRNSATQPEAKARAAGELGASLLQARRLTEAEEYLNEAYVFFTEGVERGRYALYLGSLTLAQKKTDEAGQFYREALAMAGKDQGIRFTAELNLARLAPTGERLQLLQGIAGQLAQADQQQALARFHFNLGYQAGKLGTPALPLAWQHLETARKLSAAGGDQRLYIESLDALAQLYENQKRPSEALTLNRQALEQARQREHSQVADLLIRLEWRQARLLKFLGNEIQALAAYQRAVEQIEAVRQDIPIETDDGESSFSTLLEPIYLGYVDLLLHLADQQTKEIRLAYLRRAIDTVELIKQTEMQDFLGDRCSVETVQGGSSGKVFPGTAMLYPVVFPDRIELLLQTGNGIERRSTVLPSHKLREAVMALVERLRDGSRDYLTQTQQLQQWLLAPLAETIVSENIKHLVVIPDGVLRLLPMAALHDGQRYAIEKYAITTVTGLSMTNSAAPDGRNLASLISGVSVPGQVVEKMSQSAVSDILAPASGTRGSKEKSARARQLSPAVPHYRSAEAKKRAIERLQKNLSLPGVKEEVDTLRGIMPGKTLLDGDFTVAHFHDLAQTGNYRFVHIASHGVFGGSAETSYILAHDDILTMNGLQALLKSESFQKHPIELLSLSACQTAEGNDRAPLGISGVAIKARAKSVLGTLWPVEDNAAKSIMSRFYQGLRNERLNKAEALRQAQLALIGDPQTAHPFFWAPFVLIGNWQ